MATAQTIINAALRKLGVLGVGETPSAAESADCLVTFNQLLDSLALDTGLVYAEQVIEQAITASLATIAIGTGAAWNTARPVRIIAGEWVESSDATPIDVTVPLAEFKRLSEVASTGTPTILNYEATYATGTLQWYPSPANAGTLRLIVAVPLQSALTLSTAVSMPPGYERMLTYLLAVDLAPDYEKNLSNEFMKQVYEVVAPIKRINSKTPLLRAMPGLPGVASRANILRGD